jgi:hypothetical protein
VLLNLDAAPVSDDDKELKVPWTLRPHQLGEG